MRKLLNLLEKNELLAATWQLEGSDVVVCEDSDHFSERITYASLPHDYTVQRHSCRVGTHSDECCLIPEVECE